MTKCQQRRKKVAKVCLPNSYALQISLQFDKFFRHKISNPISKMIGKAYFFLLELFIYVEVELFIHDDYPKEISATMTSSSSLCRAHELTESHAR